MSSPEQADADLSARRVKSASLDGLCTTAASPVCKGTAFASVVGTTAERES